MSTMHYTETEIKDYRSENCRSNEMVQCGVDLRSQKEGRRMRVRGVAFLAAWFALLGSRALLAQSGEQPTSKGQNVVALEESEAQVWKHRLGPATAIHVNAVEARTLGFERYLTFEIVVSADGHVESAKPVGEEKRLLDEGRAIEMARQFKPWTKDGQNIRVRVTDYVSLLTPERWALHPGSFPSPWDLKGVKIELSRTVCFGRCPAYSVTIQGDGRILFNGESFVAIPGKHDAQISSEAVSALVRRFEKARFFEAGDKYVATVTDNPTYTLTLTVGGKTKSVTDYVGEQVGMPLVITDLENAVDEVAGTERWIKGSQ
jgi:hypothetical protein